MRVNSTDRPRQSMPCKKHKLRIGITSAMVFLGCTSASHGFQLDTNPEWDIRWDNTVRYNAMFRVEKEDGKLADPSAENTLFDDATRSFDRGLVSNRIDLISELDVIWKTQYGFRVSGAAWYDDIYNKSNDHPSTSLSWGSPSARVGTFNDHAEDLHGQDIELLDAFAFANFRLGETDLNIRAGRHTLFWGQSLLTAGAIQGVAGAMAPIDAIKAFSVPGSEAQELFMPTAKLSASWQATPNLALNGYYSFEFQEHRLPAVGTYFSPAEHFTNDAEFAALIPVEQLGYVYGLRGVGEETPGDGEYGLALEFYSEGLDMDMAAYYLNYHDKLPHGLVADINLSQLPAGLGGLGDWFDGDILNPNNVSVGRFKWTYKEDIDLFGLSMAKELWGVSFGADFVYRKDAGLSPDAGAIFLGRFSLPGVFDSGFDNLDESNYGGPVGDTIHFVGNALGLLKGNSLWDGGSYMVEFTASMLDKVTENEQFLEANVEEDDIATTIAVLFTPEWFQVFPGVDMKAPISVSYGLSNFSPLVLGGAEEVGTVSAGLSFLFQQLWTFDVMYTNSFGPIQNGATTRDRDFISFTAKYTF